MMKKGRMRDIDGGWAWCVVAAHFIWLFVTVGFQKAFGLIFVEIMLRLETSTFQISWMAFIGCIVASVAGIVAGFQSDKYSMRLVMVIAACIGSVGLLILAFARHFIIVIIGRGILNALSSGIISTLLIGGYNKYFRRKRPLAGTLSSSGSSLGGLVMPVFIAYLLESHGYTQTLIIVAGLWLHGCLAGVILRTPPIPPHPGPSLKSDAKQIPTEEHEEVGYYTKTEGADGDHKKDEEQQYVEDNELQDVEDAEQHNMPDKLSVEFENNNLETGHTKHNNANNVNALGRYSFFRNPQVVRYLLASFLVSMAYFNWFIYLPLFTRQVGLTTTQTSLCISLSSLTDGIVRPVVGAILTKRNHPPDKPLISAIFCFLSGVLTLAICIASSPWVFLVYGAVYGAVDGIFMGISVPMMADHIHLSQIGSLAGVFGMAMALGVGIGTPLIGAVVDATAWFGYSMVFVAGFYVITSFIYFYNFLTVRKGKQTMAKKN